MVAGTDLIQGLEKLRTKENNSGMLSRSEIDLVWKYMLEAEVRAYYFGDLTGKYQRKKELITFVTFFLSTGAAATLIAKLPSWIPIILALITSAATTYSIVFGLDRKLIVMAQLHSQWMKIASDYEYLYHHWSVSEAGELLNDIQVREKQASETAVLDAPHIPELLDQWADHVYSRHAKVAA